MAKLIKDAGRGPIQVELTVQEQDILASVIHQFVIGSLLPMLEAGDGALYRVLVEAGANDASLEDDWDTFISLNWSDDYETK